MIRPDVAELVREGAGSGCVLSGAFKLLEELGDPGVSTTAALWTGVVATGAGVGTAAGEIPNPGGATTPCSMTVGCVGRGTALCGAASGLVRLPFTEDVSVAQGTPAGSFRALFGTAPASTGPASTAPE